MHAMAIVLPCKKELFLKLAVPKKQEKNYLGGTSFLLHLQSAGLKFY